VQRGSLGNQAFRGRAAARGRHEADRTEDGPAHAHAPGPERSGVADPRVAVESPEGACQAHHAHPHVHARRAHAVLRGRDREGPGRIFLSLLRAGPVSSQQSLGQTPWPAVLYVIVKLRFIVAIIINAATVCSRLAAACHRPPSDSLPRALPRAQVSFRSAPPLRSSTRSSAHPLPTSIPQPRATVRLTPPPVYCASLAARPGQGRSTPSPSGTSRRARSRPSWPAARCA